MPAGQQRILEQEDGKKRWVQVVMELSRAFALCAASDEATAIRDDVSYFQALQAALNKQEGRNHRTPEQIDAAVRQLVSQAITTEGQAIDVFTAAGLPKPDIGILSRAISTMEVIEKLIRLAKELDAATKRGASSNAEVLEGGLFVFSNRDAIACSSRGRM